LSLFGVHLVATLVLGYGVVPRFESLTEPPPRSAPCESALAAITRLMYFPVVTWAEGAGVSSFGRPPVVFVILNSALIAAVATGIVGITGGFKRAVA